MMRDRLPSRRGNVSFNFRHASGRLYHVSASRFENGALAEIFLDVGKIGSDVQEQAAASAVLASIALQHGVPVETLIHAVAGSPIAAALELAVLP